MTPLITGDGDPRHGLNGYTNYHCRCDTCRAANVVQNRKEREARKRRLDADPSVAPHGVPSTYFNYGCRCAHCTEAQRVANLIRKSKRLRRKSDTA